MKKVITITIEGKDEDAMNEAFTEAIRRIRQDCVEGFDTNDESSFHFTAIKE